MSTFFKFPNWLENFWLWLNNQEEQTKDFGWDKWVWLFHLICNHYLRTLTILAVLSFIIVLKREINKVDLQEVEKQIKEENEEKLYSP